MPQTAQSTTDEKIPLGFAPATPKGTPGPIDGTFKYEVLEGGATVETDPDGVPLFAVSEDTAGFSRIRFWADVDLDPNVEKQVEDILEYTYVSPQVSTLGFTAGAAVPK